MKMNQKYESKFTFQNLIVATKLLTLFTVSTLSKWRLLFQSKKEKLYGTKC